MKKSIVLLTKDLFFSLVDSFGLSYDQVEKKVFSDISGVNFLFIKIPTIFSGTLPPKDPYNNWSKECLPWDKHSVYEFYNQKQKIEKNFLFLMFGSKNGTSICSVHASDLPKLRRDTRPPFVAMVNGGKKTKSNFIRPFLEYREYPFPGAESITNYFYSGYKNLLKSKDYHYDVIDNEVEDIFSNTDTEEIRKGKDFILKTLPH